MMDSYTVLAKYYDQLTTDVGYENWARYIQRHFARLDRPVRRVVELACGTGSLTHILAEQGYQMTAVDLSPDMLSLAAQKCQGQQVLFLCQDMSRLALLEEPDAVLCCLDSLNYVTRPAVLRRTFARVHQALAPGGLFLFDVKTPLALERADGQVYLDETEDLLCVWRGEYHPRRRVCSYDLDLFTLDSDGLWRRESEYHEEYAYTMDELEDFLAQAGFHSIKQYADQKMTTPKEGAERVFFTAHKE